MPDDLPPTRAAIGRGRLAGGAATVAAGLAVAGAATLVVLAVVARGLPADDYAAYAVWWTTATLLGTSFGVFETYLARASIAELASGGDGRAATGVIQGRALAVTAAIGAVLLVTAPLLSHSLFGGHIGAALLLPVFVTLSATQAVQRGSATGHGRFSAVAIQLTTDGVSRVILVAIVVGGDLGGVSALAAVSCAASLLGLASATFVIPEWVSRPTVRGGLPVGPLGLLLVGSLGPLLANNGPVPWLAGATDARAAVVGALAGAVTLSRIPTQFVAAGFSPLLAQLSLAVEARDAKSFQRLHRLAEVVAVAMGAVFVAAFALFGRSALELYLGAGYQLPVTNLVLLAASSALMFMAVVPQASLSALDHWGTIASSWLVGSVVFVGVLGLPVDGLDRATSAPAAGVVTALVLMTVRSRRAVSRAF